MLNRYRLIAASSGTLGQLWYHSLKRAFREIHPNLAFSKKYVTVRLLVVGLFSKGQRSAFISGTGRTTRRYGREGLGTRREKTDCGLFRSFWGYARRPGGGEGDWPI